MNAEERVYHWSSKDVNQRLLTIKIASMLLVISENVQNIISMLSLALTVIISR